MAAKACVPAGRMAVEANAVHCAMQAAKSFCSGQQGSADGALSERLGPVLSHPGHGMGIGISKLTAACAGPVASSVTKTGSTMLSPNPNIRHHIFSLCPRKFIMHLFYMPTLS